MDKLLNEFTVHRPIADTWVVLTDVERIAPCLPGAELKEIEGDTYRGVVKVKLGAIATAFKGEAHFLERDDTNYRAVLKGEGRDTSGKGNADALITAQLTAIDEHSTKCVVETDLKVTGKVAQFGRGIMGDVSKKLMEQFAHNLNTMLEYSAENPHVHDADPVEQAAASAPTEATATAEPSNDPQPEPQPQVRRIEGPAAAPLDLGDVAGTAVLKRALPLVGGLLVVLFVVRRLLRSR
jgi:carbon monoxide dehydrogenase subunit G